MWGLLPVQTPKYIINSLGLVINSLKCMFEADRQRGPPDPNLHFKYLQKYTVMFGHSSRIMDCLGLASSS